VSTPSFFLRARPSRTQPHDRSDLPVSLSSAVEGAIVTLLARCSAWAAVGRTQGDDPAGDRLPSPNGCGSHLAVCVPPRPRP